MDRRCDINMDPDTRPIKAQMGTNKEAGAGALGVLPVLSKKKDVKHQVPKRKDNISCQANILLEILSNMVNGLLIAGSQATLSNKNKTLTLMPTPTICLQIYCKSALHTTAT